MKGEMGSFPQRRRDAEVFLFPPSFVEWESFETRARARWILDSKEDLSAMELVDDAKNQGCVGESPEK